MMEKSAKKIMILFISLAIALSVLFYVGAAKLSAFASDELEGYVNTVLEEAEPEGEVVTGEELDAILETISNESALAIYQIVTRPDPGEGVLSADAYENFTVIRGVFLDAVLLVANCDNYTSNRISQLRYADGENVDRYIQKYEDPDYAFKRFVSILTNDFSNLYKAQTRMEEIDDAVTVAKNAIDAIKLYDKGTVTLAESLASIENATEKLNLIYNEDIDTVIENGENIAEYIPQYETVYLTALDNYKGIMQKIDAVNDLLDTVYLKYGQGKRLSIVSEINGLKDAYADLDDDELQAFIVDYDEKLGEMETGVELERQNVNNVIGLITAIGAVHYTDECLEKINDAKEAYGELCEDSRTDDNTFVTNYTVMIEAEKEYNRRSDVLEKAKKNIYNAAVCEASDFKVNYYETQMSWVYLTIEEDFADIFKHILEDNEIFSSEVGSQYLIFNDVQCDNYFDLYAEESSKYSENIRLASDMERMISDLGEVCYTSEYADKLSKVGDFYDALDDTVRPYVSLYSVFLEKVEVYEKMDEEVKAVEEKYETATKSDKNLSSETIGKIKEANDAREALFEKYPQMEEWLENNEEYSEKYAAFTAFEEEVASLKTTIETMIDSIGEVDLLSREILDAIEAKIEEYACDDTSAIDNYAEYTQAESEYLAVIADLDDILYEVYKLCAKDEAVAKPTENTKEELERLLSECVIDDDFTAEISQISEIKREINSLEERNDAELSCAHVTTANEKLDEIAVAVLKKATALKNDIDDIEEPYDKEELESLQDRYDDLTDDEKVFVDNYDKLQAALESVYAAEAKEVYDRIEALDEPYELEILDSIQKDYDALSESQKKLVTNYDKLREAYFVLGVYDSGCEGSVGGQTAAFVLAMVAILLIVKKRKA